MSCTNCYTGCGEIFPDKCIKYTGETLQSLEITQGDPLSVVIQKLTSFLSSVLSGEGIAPDLTELEICALVQGNLPQSDISLNDVVRALITSACSLQTQVTSLNSTVTTLQEAYTPGCVDVSGSAGTHAVLQAVITKLCALNTSLTSLSSDLSTNYVPLAGLNTLIAAYLSSAAPSSFKSRMVPYTATEYYGSLEYFDPSGAGTGEWAEIYLCNGNHGTPDKRGRTPVGTTQMGGGAYSPVVDPAIPGNPSYTLLSTAGTNNTVLSASQIPSHTHAASAAVTDAGHKHFDYSDDSNPGGEVSATTYPSKRKTWTDGNSQNYDVAGSEITPTLGKSSTATTGISVSVTNAATGGGASHSNIQPVIACHYIMYIPLS